MKPTPRLLMGLLLGSAALLTQAEETPNGLVGDVALGVARQSGNTTSSSAYLKSEGVLTQDQWRHTGKIDYNFQSSDDKTTAEGGIISWKTDYRATERSYWYGYGSARDDRFSGIAEEYVLSGGYGRVLIDDGVFLLEMEGGPGLRKTNPTSGATRDDGIFRFAQKFDWKLSETASFKQRLSVETGGGNTVSAFEAALETQVVNNIGLRLSYHVDHVHRVPADRDNTDTRLMASLVYKY